MVIVGAISEDLSIGAPIDGVAIVIAGHRNDAETARHGLAMADGRCRELALGALARCEALTMSDLQTAAVDEATEVRRRAAELAAAFDDRPVTDLLLGLLDDGELVVAEMAAWALGERSASTPVVTALARTAADHEEPLCREAAVAALGALGDRDGLAAILGGTEDIATVRRRAVLALAPFEGAEVDAALDRALGDRDWQVRQAAEDLLDVPPA